MNAPSLPTRRGPLRGSRILVAGAIGALVLLSAAWATGDDDTAHLVGDELIGATPTELTDLAPTEDRAGANPGPTRTVAGAPAGFEHSDAGAVAAAASFATDTPLLVDMDSAGVEAAVRQSSSAAVADARVAETLGELDAIEAVTAHGIGPMLMHEAPLAWRLVSYSPARARVAVWTVSVASIDGVLEPLAVWWSATVDLVWERGDWRLVDLALEPGPTPVVDDLVPPASAAELAASLEGFSGFELAPR